MHCEKFRDKTGHVKPKLLFFRNDIQNLPVFIRRHLEEHVKCLSLSFEVILIAEHECDYRAACEVHEPDMALFESGIYSDRRRTIRNTNAFPEIPKIGFLNADAYCSSRRLFLAEMASWGVETFFTISVSMAEYTPEIAHNLFVWPNFADADVYKDYGENKVIPVLFTGSLQTHYPWRNRIYRRVSPHYPSLTCPHFGWFHDGETARMLSGERYARLLNASLVVPSCGTIANEVVRKHFEIPGSRACLLAPQSSALEPAGFIHMVNCVFTDESSVVDHLDYLFKNPDELERITRAGYELVHSFHTIRHRDQLYQWFRLNKELRPNQRIVQTGPFAPLTVTENVQVHNTHVAVNGIDRALLHAGYQQMWAGDYASARKNFLQCVNYQAIPEPKLALVILSLLVGDLATARYWCSNLLEPVIGESGTGMPDPVEWAMFILMTLCQGNREEATAAARRFLKLRHPVLDRVTRIVAEMTGNQLGMDLTADRRISYSIHRLPELDSEEWESIVRLMLRACGQSEMADRVSRAAGEKIAIAVPATHPAVDVRKKFYFSRRTGISTRKIRDSLRSYLRHRIKGTLQSVEGRVGYFLPYKSSKASRDELFSLIEKLAGEEPVGKVVFIGARKGNYLTESVLSGIRRNPTLPPVVFVNEDDKAFHELREHYGRDLQIVQISKSIESPSEESGVLLIVDGSELKSTSEHEQHLSYATVVVLDDINDARIQPLHLSLATNSSYMLIAHSPEHGNGYAILRRKRNFPAHDSDVYANCRSFSAAESMHVAAMEPGGECVS